MAKSFPPLKMVSFRWKTSKFNRSYGNRWWRFGPATNNYNWWWNKTITFGKWREWVLNL